MDAEMGLSESADHPLLFRGLRSTDADFIMALIEVISDMAGRPGLRPKDLRAISHLLLGLRRLPLATPGLHVNLQSYVDTEDECAAYQLVFDHDRFRAATGSCPTPGGQAIYGPYFEASFEGNRHVDPEFDGLEWAEQFFKVAIHSRLEIEDVCSGATLDWEQDDGLEFWELLPE